MTHGTDSCPEVSTSLATDKDSYAWQSSMIALDAPGRTMTRASSSVRILSRTASTRSPTSSTRSPIWNLTSVGSTPHTEHTCTLANVDIAKDDAPPREGGRSTRVARPSTRRSSGRYVPHCSARWKYPDAISSTSGPWELSSSMAVRPVLRHTGASSARTWWADWMMRAQTEMSANSTGVQRGIGRASGPGFVPRPCSPRLARLGPVPVTAGRRCLHGRR